MNFLARSINGAKFFRAYIKKTIYCDYPPLVLMVEPTNICNIRCGMCPNKIMTREKGFMSFELYKKLIDDNHDFIQSLNLFVLGEPLLNRRLPEMVLYAKNRNIKTVIFTNGTLLDKDLSRKLIIAGIDEISISFEGGSCLTENIFNNIKILLMEKKKINKHSPLICVRLINSGFAYEAVSGMIKNLKLLGVNYVLNVPIHDWTGKYSLGLKDKRLTNKVGKNYFHCVLPWSVLAVHWNGEVVGCCDDFDGEFIIGDINKTPKLFDIWNNNKMCFLRKMLADQMNGNINICKNCARLQLSPFKSPILENVLYELLAYCHSSFNYFRSRF